MDNKYKMMIPKYLTLSRIVMTPIIIFLGIMKWYIALIIVTVLAFLTNALDHTLNQKWHVNSKSRIKLDLFANKTLLLGITSWLMFQYHNLIVIFVLELLLIIINLFFFNKTNKIEILKIGKWKDILFSITLLSYLFLLVSFGKINICNGFTYVVINLQVLSILKYLIFYIPYKSPSIENNTMHQTIMKSDELEKTIVLDDINSLEKGIYDIEKDQY